MATKMTREEAINKVRQMNLPKETMEILEALVPELAESEDERIRKELIKLLTVASEASLVKSTGIKKDSYLAYLEKQKEQKPTEWSEDDEKIAYFVNQFLEYHENADPTAKSCKKWFNNRLKSLRPSWKPSEEQMNALLNAEGFLRAGLQHDSAKTIAELYEQLKKL